MGFLLPGNKGIVNSESGSHGLRYHEDKLEYKNGGQWKQIKTGTTIVDNLESDSSTEVLSAKQGKMLDGKITELKNSVSNGKSLVAAAITNKGVETAETAEFATMATNINNISSFSQSDVKVFTDSGYTAGNSKKGIELKIYTFNYDIKKVLALMALYTSSYGNSYYVLYKINNKNLLTLYSSYEASSFFSIENLSIKDTSITLSINNKASYTSIPSATLHIFYI